MRGSMAMFKHPESAGRTMERTHAIATGPLKVLWRSLTFHSKEAVSL